MKKITYLKVLLFLGFCQYFIMRACDTEVITVYYKKETIHGQTFIYREDTINGKKKCSWTVDGNAVDASDYEEALLEAEKEVRRQARQKEEENRVREWDLQLQAMVALVKKQVHLKITAIEAELQRIDDQRLKPFLLFENHTLASQEALDTIVRELIPGAKKIVADSGDVGREGLHELNSYADRLEGISERVRDFFYASVNNAINHCDDTRLLKEFLNLISGGGR